MSETEKLLEYISKENSIKKILKQVPDITFTDYLNTLLVKYKKSKNSLVKDSNISRTYAYQIINGTKMPSKDKVIALAIALKCDLHETNNLLNLSNNGNLYSKVKRDALIIKSLNNKYSVEKTNILLDEYNLEILK